jgi:lysyl-tRNA synthetase class 2
MPTPEQWSAAQSRQILYSSVRRSLLAHGYMEVETPCLVPSPGLEPHITAFEVGFVPETGLGKARPLYLHTSPEYAMKRLLADGSGPLFQIAKVFRNGEISAAHNPEFTLLELYRPNADGAKVMEELEDVLSAAASAVGGDDFFMRRPYQRLTVRDAVLNNSGIDLWECPDAPSLRKAAERAGIRMGDAQEYEDVFFHIFLQRVEPTLGQERPVFLIEYPAPLAALARIKPDDPRVAERFELYARSAELANGFTELTDPTEQRRRLEEEQQLRRRLGRAIYAIDEAFLDALKRMPPSGGVAVGLDRILMQLLGREDIESVLLFPARAFLS